MKDLIVIGGGAAGFFFAANFKSPLWKVRILEQSDEAMRKVKASGGGRCNLTHACFKIGDLVKFYPRGGKELKKVYTRFQPSDTIEWFESRGVDLKKEKDNRMFPLSDSAYSVSDLLMREAMRNGTKIEYDCTVKEIVKEEDAFLVQTNKQTYRAAALVVTSGSAPKLWNILQALGHSIVPPLPSLFTFRSKASLIKDLPGTSFSNASLSVQGLKQKSNGPLLITHQGLSGPATLRLSAWAARELAELNYRFPLKINWLSQSFDELREFFQKAKEEHPKKRVSSLKVYDLTQRFWQTLLHEIQISDKLVGDLSKTDINKIAEVLTNTLLQVQGKNVFKDEFVTAGGIDLNEVDFASMQSKKVKNLFFAGEVLNIDGVTGGFNFQACWSEAFIISEFLKQSDIEPEIF